MVTTIILLVVSIAVILVCAELFTNSIEWLGHRLKLGEGAVGSILAAVGTAMPETMIPIIAILFVGTERSKDVGIGAILGAPFMLSTAAFFVTAMAVWTYTLRRRRTLEMVVNFDILKRDVGFFLPVYAVALGSSLLPSRELKWVTAIGLLITYAVYAYLTLKQEGDLSKDLNPLHFARHVDEPGLLIIVGQVLVALLGIILGSHVFVANLEEVSHAVGVPTLVLALIIAPLATELPEKFNSVLWVRERKDTLAMGNITGAMLFQSCIPVAIGLMFTPWVLDTPALLSGILALLSAGLVYVMMVARGKLSAGTLGLGGLFYVAFVAYVIRQGQSP
ncbi:MAG: sodium:calcium antiporter [Chloroflexi bacterium]|nr:sodium:calcium antiporter [Chloroflexota bacterium]